MNKHVIMTLDASEVDEELLELAQEMMDLGVEIRILPHDRFVEHLGGGTK